MAKKKSKKNELGLILRFLSIVIGVAVICFAFLDGVKFTGKIFGTEPTLTGFEVMFGTENIVDFSFMAVLAFVLPLAGGVLMMFKNKLLNFIAIACFIAGAVMLFLVPSFVVLATNSIYLLYDSGLAIGTILAAIFAIIGALVAGYTTFKTK